MVVNNSDFNENEIPNEIYNGKHMQLYCYPKQSNNNDFKSFRNQMHVIDHFHKMAGSKQLKALPMDTLKTSSYEPKRNIDQRATKSLDQRIRFKSIKKMAPERARDKNTKMYEKIMIIHPKDE